MTAPRRLRTRARNLVLASLGAGALVLVAACGSASDLVGVADPSPTEATPPIRTLPPSESAPTPSATPTPVVTLPKVGECRKPGTVDATLRVSDDDTAPVACAGATALTYLVRTMPGPLKAAVADYNTTRILRTARPICEKAAIGYLGKDRPTYERSQFGFIVGVPSAAQTAAGAAWMRCDLVLSANASNLAALPGKTKGALSSKQSGRYMQCVRGDIRVAVGTVVCSTKHRWRGVDSVRLGAVTAKYPGTKRAQSTMRDRCTTSVRRYLDTRGSFEYGYISPSKASWQRGERWGVCFAKTKK
ncbi:MULTISPECIES: septum formation family protein [Mumia]|uniref:Septum formation family protein n=1 Tax=Mumia xiangluensis TaxID=1678900 RepID=A0ABW1QKI6_9ACTN|nr:MULTISPECIES: septum formation family protein [Mumia]